MRVEPIFDKVASVRLPGSAVWRVVHSLSAKELRRLRGKVKGTRLGWLLKTLLAMRSYSERELLEAYQEAFPMADRRLLPVYKRQLWELIEALLPTPETEWIGTEVRIWHRFWLSVLLWQRGLYDLAEVLWRQAMQAAMDIGWYEVALWGVSLLEVYARDFHWVAPTEKVGTWSEKIISLITTRYSAIIQKMAFAESQLISRRPQGQNLPHPPSEERWALYMQGYLQVLQASYRGVSREDFLLALEKLTSMIRCLLGKMPFPQGYVQFHLALSLLNLGILLLNLRAWDLYETWYSAWGRLWKKRHWPLTDRYKEMYRTALSLQCLYLIQRQRWEAAKKLWEEKKEDFQLYIFSGTENILFRTQMVNAIYLILLLMSKSSGEVTRWRLRAEGWLLKEGFTKDYPFLWWVFLRWYEAFRSGDKNWMRHWYRKLRLVWYRQFHQMTRWIPVFRVLKSLGQGLPSTQKRRIKSLLRYWDTHPEENTLWEGGASPFPMRLFMESLLRRQPLEALNLSISSPTPLPPSLQKAIQDLLYNVEKLTSS